MALRSLTILPETELNKFRINVDYIWCFVAYSGKVVEKLAYTSSEVLMVTYTGKLVLKVTYGSIAI